MFDQLFTFAHPFTASFPSLPNSDSFVHRCNHPLTYLELALCHPPCHCYSLNSAPLTLTGSSRIICLTRLPAPTLSSQIRPPCCSHGCKTIISCHPHAWIPSMASDCTWNGAQATVPQPGWQACDTRERTRVRTQESDFSHCSQQGFEQVLKLLSTSVCSS